MKNLELWWEWIKALRSGKYAQGHGHLRQHGVADPKFCCLGVYCESRHVPAREEAGRFYYDNSEATLPKWLAEELGINGAGHFTSAGRRYWAVTGRRSLTEVNDDGSVGFEAIANFLAKAVEAHLHGEEWFIPNIS